MSTENSVPLTTLSQKEYLKRYLFKGKKKTKKKVVTRSNVKVIDDNDLKASFVEEDADLETGDDAPLIAALIDERPTTIKKLEQFENDSRWAPVPVVNEEVKNPLTKPVGEKICGKSLDQFSPEIEPSIPENLRKHTRKREESLTALSPSRKRKYSANYDSFKNKNTLPENGKPKKKRESSPYEGKKESRMKTSPRSRKNESKSHFEDHSKTSKHSKSKKYYESDDSSSTNRTHRKHDNRNREKDSSSTHSQRDNSICSPEVAKKKRRYGSSNKKHKKSTKSSDSESSLERSSHSKKKKLSETSKSKSKERKMKSKKKNKDHDRSPERKSESKKLSSSESSKPLARYIDDEDMNEHLKVMIREGDTMLEYLEKKKTKSDSKEDSKHKYKGPFPLNRFGIPPGYRWDGVDRSNGYEKKYLGKDKQKEALEEEAYKWSVSDM